MSGDRDGNPGPAKDKAVARARLSRRRGGRADGVVLWSSTPDEPDIDEVVTPPQDPVSSPQAAPAPRPDMVRQRFQKRLGLAAAFACLGVVIGGGVGINFVEQERDELLATGARVTGVVESLHTNRRGKDPTMVVDYQVGSAAWTAEISRGNGSPVHAR